MMSTTQEQSLNKVSFADDLGDNGEELRQFDLQLTSCNRQFIAIFNQIVSHDYNFWREKFDNVKVKYGTKKIYILEKYKVT